MDIFSLVGSVHREINDGSGSLNIKLFLLKQLNQTVKSKLQTGMLLESENWILISLQWISRMCWQLSMSKHEYLLRPLYSFSIIIHYLGYFHNLGFCFPLCSGALTLFPGRLLDFIFHWLSCMISFTINRFDPCKRSIFHALSSRFWIYSIDKL